ncbi:hypothetical protein EMPS_03557 [Entomortierella parvispora]|uniref:DUF676 domain-containing protein n=1 Tax=Entomortierella parvispora TaxID=205924 RepID=A0A9P3H7L1_9FUNG|nr:hypothetical protein EMPS_03557 [Entomortierella parvispora]
MTSDATHEGVHLVILHHGLWGNVNHVRFIAEQFKQRLGDRILVYRAQANESALTYDGVDICGQRLVQEIHSVIKVIEAGGNIEEMKGQKHKSKKSKKDQSTATAPTKTTDQESLASGAASTTSSTASTTRTKKVTQFSFLGYSLGGLIGRFAMGILELEGFFEKVKPMYFVTMATPHLGIRKPPKTTWSKVFNFLSSRMLSRSGEQMQLIDDYIGGKPVLLVMSDPAGIFVQALAKFKRRAIYCNVANDRSVPFWTASFSDADPFTELETVEIQYSSGYSSLIESFEPQGIEELSRKREAQLKELESLSFSERTSLRLKAIPWRRYAFFGILGPILIPVWIVIATSTISVQGYNSRRRTKPMVDTNPELDRVRDEALGTKSSDTVPPSPSRHRRLSLQRTVSHTNNDKSKTTTHITTFQNDTQSDSSVTLTINEPTPAHAKQSSSTSPQSSALSESTVETVTGGVSEEDQAPISYSFPHLKQLQPLGLLPVQVEISRNLNTLDWKKNIIHIEAMNAHASIVVRENRFSNDGGIAAVQHAVDMFKDDGEDE